MKSGAKLLTVLLTGFVSGMAALPVHADAVEDAKKLFEQYTALESSGDPAVTGLYSETAKIKIYKAYKDGSRIREATELTAYKEMRKTALAQKVIYVYSDPVFTPIGSNIKIKASRIKANAGKKETPYSHMMTVGPDTDGQWRILEETPTIDGE